MSFIVNLLVTLIWHFWNKMMKSLCWHAYEENKIFVQYLQVYCLPTSKINYPVEIS